MSKPIVAVVGRPNVGKSTLFNKLCGQRLAIVEDTPGITRDRIFANCEWNGHEFLLVDTGGIEPKATEGILAHMREQAQIAIDTADCIIMVTDVRNGLTAADEDVAHMLRRSHKPIILAVNKWDAVEGKETNTMELQRRGYAECFSFMGYAPIIFISAQTGYNVNKLMQLIRDVDAENGARVPTGVLNEMLARATARMQPPSDKGRRLKIYYLTQASTRPPTFVAFVNAKHLFHFSYQRYLINQIRENFGLEHTPIRLVVRERGSGEVGAKDV